MRLKRLMAEALRWLEEATPLARAAVLVALVLVSSSGAVVNNLCIKLSAMSNDWRRFLVLQVIGNLAGFVGLLGYTALLRFVPLHVGYPLTVGLAAVGVQVFASRVILGESIGRNQWLGTAFIVLGVALVASRSRP
ncbi:MAG: hypothetical protein ACYC5O_11270 [Anaerolineae bacterium]